jgi:hypothetical protein
VVGIGKWRQRWVTRRVLVTTGAGDMTGKNIDVVPESGEGGPGTEGIAAIASGGGLALLFGVYALLRRVGHDSDGIETSKLRYPRTVPGASATTQEH